MNFDLFKLCAYSFLTYMLIGIIVDIFYLVIIKEKKAISAKIIIELSECSNYTSDTELQKSKKENDLPDARNKYKYCDALIEIKNSGRQTIYSSDFADSNPLVIRIPNGSLQKREEGSCTILEAPNNNVGKFSLSDFYRYKDSSDEGVNISFDFWKKNEKLLILIHYISNLSKDKFSITVSGTLKEGKNNDLLHQYAHVYLFTTVLYIIGFVLLKFLSSLSYLQIISAIIGGATGGLLFNDVLSYVYYEALQLKLTRCNVFKLRRRREIRR